MADFLFSSIALLVCIEIEIKFNTTRKKIYGDIYNESP